MPERSRRGLRSRLVLVAAGAALLAGSPERPACAEPPVRIPATRAVALDGHTVVLPSDLAGRVTVLILGFGRNSADPTTAWEKPTRTSLAHEPGIGFYDMPMLAEVPGMIRPLILRAIRRKVPDVLRPNFVPLTSDEAGWKRAASFDEHEPDAAYVLLVDRSGAVQWSTHAAYTPGVFEAMAQEARKLSGQ